MLLIAKYKLSRRHGVEKLDKDNRQISVQSYNKDNVYDYFSVGNNRSEIVFVNADKITAANPHGPGYEETSFAFNAGGTNNYTYVQTMGGIGIEYTNSGTHGVVATRAASNDKYDCGLSSSNNVQIEENGGNDTIVLGSHTDSQDPETWNDIGIVCNVYKYQTGLDTWEWRTDRNHVVYVEKEALTIDSLRAATEATLTETAGVNMLDNSQTGGIEQIKGGYYGYADADAWFGEIASEVGSWLAGNGYTSVEGAVNAHYTSGADISGLVQAFVDAKYSNAVPV